MPRITKPLLAAKFDPAKAKFPYIATPKIDGIRFLMVDGVAVSRSFKPIRNTFIQLALSENLPNGIDGELTFGNNFQDTTSAIMKIDGIPSDFKAWIFDYVNPNDNRILPFTQRMQSMPKMNLPFDHEILWGANAESMVDVDAFETSYLNLGYEGIMLRDPNGTYKFGRSTVNENILLKVKRFLDDEAVVVGIEEKMSNQNTAEKDNFGRTKRSSAIDGKVPAGTAGAFVLERGDGERFSCGSGFDDKLRDRIWADPDSYMGKIVKYKYFPHGVKNLPRHPVFLGFRDKDDM
jgi:DNA ligase-1